MKQILFLSGKGGTGKTTLAAAFAVLSEDRILADCDVDAANFHLLLDPHVVEEGEFQGSKEAVRDSALCVECGQCRSACRFNAIGPNLEIDPFMCEGCGACVTACPTGALALEPRISGRWFNAQTDWGMLASAELLPGEETSGKLVSQVKRNMQAMAENAHPQWAIVDGSPGIGCPVIASVSGVDAVILVTEPSLSGMHDLERILGVVNHFRIPSFLVINKADLSAEMAQRLAQFALANELPLLGSIPYDPAVAACLLEGRSVVSEKDSLAGSAMRAIYTQMMEAIRD